MMQIHCKLTNRRSFVSKKDLATIMNNLAKANRASFFDKRIDRKRVKRAPVKKNK
jgi:hypothetical protein